MVRGSILGSTDKHIFSFTLEDKFQSFIRTVAGYCTPCMQLPVRHYHPYFHVLQHNFSCCFKLNNDDPMHFLHNVEGKEILR